MPELLCSIRYQEDDNHACALYEKYLQNLREEISYPSGGTSSQQ
jgi:hypothetical protein